MKGTLHKTEQGWIVEYAKHSELPLHPDDVNLMPFRGQLMNDQHIMNGKEVEFEIVNVWETNTNTDRKLPTLDDFKHYAKLIPSKEQQKQFITEIMEEDAKDGLYEDDVEKLADEEFDNIDNPTRSGIDKWSYKIGFIESYKKAKETLYTEEQVRFIICKSFLLGVDRGEYSKDFEDRMIESLKQPKQ